MVFEGDDVFFFVDPDSGSGHKLSCWNLGFYMMKSWRSRFSLDPDRFSADGQSSEMVEVVLVGLGP